MPPHSLFINKLSGPLSMRYIFIASYNMCCSWSVFILFPVFFCFVCCNKWLDPIIHVLEETHSVLIAWNTLVFTLIVPRVFQFFQYCVQLLFPLLFCSELVSFLYLCMISSLVFIDFYLRELFQISWLVLETSKMFHIYSDANGSLFRLWHRLWLVMLGVILHVLVIIVLA